MSRSSAYSLLLFFTFVLINNPKANSRKTCQGHQHGVLRLTNHDKDNRMLLADLLATLQTLCFCQWHLWKTQASLLRYFACHSHFENLTETLIRYCQRILKVGFVKVSKISLKIMELYSVVCNYFLEYMHPFLKYVHPPFLKTGVILANFKKFRNFTLPIVSLK